MKIDVSETPGFSQPTVGNVYAIKGGYGSKLGHMGVLIAITARENCLLLIIDREGDPVGVTSYGLHAIEERCPVAFVEGLESLHFKMVPINYPDVRGRKKERTK
jgi:hypothetical protein